MIPPNLQFIHPNVIGQQYKVAKAFAICFVGCLMLFTYGIAAYATDKVADLRSQTLFYAVTYQKLNAGRLEVVIQRDETQIKITAISHLSALARLFLTDLTTETWLNVESQKISLHRGRVLASDNKTVERSFVIEQERGSIKFEPQGKHVPINPADIFEPVSFPIILITSDIQTIAGQTVQESSPEGIREYIYLTPQQQTLELNGRKFDTWKVTRQKPNDPTRTVTIWLDKNNQQIPVKIISSRKGQDTVMTLLPK